MRPLTITLVEVPRASTGESRRMTPRRIQNERRVKFSRRPSKYVNPRPAAKFENLLKTVCHKGFYVEAFAHLSLSVGGQHDSTIDPKRIEKKTELLFSLLDHGREAFECISLSDETIGDIKDFYRLLAFTIPLPMSMGDFVLLFKVIFEGNFRKTRNRFLCHLNKKLSAENVHVRFNADS